MIYLQNQTPSAKKVLSYWTNSNPKINQFGSRLEIVNKLYYNKFKGKVRFLPVYKFRSFWSRRRQWQNSMFDIVKDFSHYELDTLHIDFKRINNKEQSRSATYKKNQKFLKESYKLLQFLMRNNLQHIRMEGSAVDVYWDNLDWIDNAIETKFSSNVFQISLCDPNIKPDEEAVDELPLDKYQYRVILKDMRNIESNKVTALLDLNQEGNIKITERRIGSWTEQRMFYKDWFYAEDEMALTTVSLILGTDIHKVVKFVRRNQ